MRATTHPLFSWDPRVSKDCERLSPGVWLQPLALALFPQEAVLLLQEGVGATPAVGESSFLDTAWGSQGSLLPRVCVSGMVLRARPGLQV